MPASTEGPHATETPSGFFNSAFMENIDSYFDFPPGDTKTSQDASLPETSFHSPRLTPSASPTLNPQYRPASPEMWGGIRGSPGPGDFSSFAPELSLNSTPDLQTASKAQQSGIAPLQISGSFMGQPSPPDSSGSSPDKYAMPGNISPLDSLISHLPASETRTVHGQVTPPNDFTKSPTLSHMQPSLVLPMRLISPEQSPVLSPRSTTSPRHRGESISEGAKTTSDREMAGSKRRRSSTGQSSRKARKSVSADEAPEVQEAKRRRFLERNRVAASKCRQKKKAWMQDLETEAREAQSTSKQLKACVSVLKEEVLILKNELLKHNTCECLPIRQYLSNEAMRLADGALARGARSSNASEFSFTPSDTPECKIHPAFQRDDGNEFDMEFVDNVETVMA